MIFFYIQFSLQWLLVISDSVFGLISLLMEKDDAITSGELSNAQPISSPKDTILGISDSNCLFEVSCSLGINILDYILKFQDSPKSEVWTLWQLKHGASKKQLFPSILCFEDYMSLYSKITLLKGIVAFCISGRYKAGQL